MLETIVALATAPIKSALGIIRLSGDDVFEIVSKISSIDITGIKERTVKFCKIIDNGRVVDEVVMIIYVAPRSFTGENSVEIICHGSVLIENEIISLLIKSGARYALNGEFSSRGFLNNKMDLIQAEAINDAINATTVEAKNLAMLSIEGKTSSLIEPIKTKLADIISLIEVNIDYPEYYDIEQVTKEKINSDAGNLIILIKNTIKDGYKGNIIKDGINISIVGKPNAGKSTILNAFLNEKKAIVTSIPGTTRDIVEGSISLNGIAINLKDTAGIRESNDEVEIIGIEKSKEAIKKSEIVLYVVDSTDKDEDKDLLELLKDKNVIKIYNKSDLEYSNEEGLHVSAITGNIEVIKEKILDVLDLKKENYVNPSVNNIRELGLLSKVQQCLSDVYQANLDGVSLDLISIPLREAYETVLEILGETSNLDISKEIFSRFCVGK